MGGGAGREGVSGMSGRLLSQGSRVEADILLMAVGRSVHLTKTVLCSERLWSSCYWCWQHDKFNCVAVPIPS